MINQFSLKSKQILQGLSKLNAKQNYPFCWQNRFPEVYAKFIFPEIIQTSQTNSQNRVFVIKKVSEQTISNSFQLDQLKKNKAEWVYSSNELQTLINYVGKEEKEGENAVQKDQDTLDALKQKQLESLVAQGSKIARSLHARKITESDIVFDADLTSEEIQHYLKGFLLANYKFKMSGIEEEKLTEEEKKALFKPISKINVKTDNNQIKLTDEDFQFVQKAAYYTLYARQLGNLRADIANTEFFLKECKNIVAANPGKVILEYLKGEELVEQGLNLAHAVGKGSKNPPIVANLTYFGDSSRPNEVDIAFIGKGVCFDAGGLNIKPTGFMETMYMDKGGAVATLTSFRAAVELGLKVNLTVTIGLVENFLSSTSYRPSDIIKSHKGLTVEIGNTDAEGRLVLADCMSWTQQKHKPKTMIELSTLTGACVVALGEEQAGLFTNDEVLSKQLQEASKISGDSLWRLPITDAHREAMKGTYSDLNNSGKTRYGGASQAAAFLEKFVEKDVKWAHIDIAGPAESKSDKGQWTTGMTGFGVQLLLQFLKSQQKK
ncbi:hypothetical protein ABPG72_002519 [Tetrahymena utriculariae]